MTQIGKTIWSGKPSREAEARLLSGGEMTHINWDRTSVKTERCVLGDPAAWPLSPGVTFCDRSHWLAREEASF